MTPMPIGMRDVAREAGVSYTTVSNVLTQRPNVSINPVTRERVLRAAQRLNYRYNALAADLRRGATTTVAIQLPSLSNPILASKVAWLEQNLRKAGLFPFLCHTLDVETEQRFYEGCASRQVCGVVGWVE